MSRFVFRQLLSLVILCIIVAISAGLTVLGNQVFGLEYTFEETLLGVIMGFVAVNTACSLMKDDEDG